MKNVIAFVLVIGFIAAGAGYLITQLQGQVVKAQYDAAVAAARVEAVRQASLVNLVPDDKVGFDRAQLLRKHIDTLGAIYKEHPGQHKEDGFIEDMEAKAKEGKKDKAKTAEYRARYDYVKEMWGKLKEGNYKPVLTGQNNGMRLDILTIKKATEAGQEGLRMDVFLWGPIKDQITFGNIEIQFVRDIVEKDARGNEIIDRKTGKPKTKQALAKIQGAGPPYVLQEKPWEWITEWPPGVMVGYYVGLPLFAPDASKFTMKMDFQMRTNAGTAIPVNLEWKNVDVDPSWRSPPDAEWDAEVQEATDEELAAAGIKP